MQRNSQLCSPACHATPWLGFAAFATDQRLSWACFLVVMETVLRRHFMVFATQATSGDTEQRAPYDNRHFCHTCEALNDRSSPGSSSLMRSCDGDRHFTIVSRRIALRSHNIPSQIYSPTRDMAGEKSGEAVTCQVHAERRIKLSKD